MLAMWNILPLLQGSSVLSMPYAIAYGGYLIIPMIIIISIMADATGLLLTDCLYAISPKSMQRKRVHLNYADIARTVWGEHGARLLNAILIFYLFTGDVVNILLLGKSIYDLLYPYTTLSFVVLTSIFSVIAYPTLFAKKMTHLAYLSMFSVVSILVGIATTTVMFIVRYADWKENAKHIPVVNMDRTPLAVSIIMFSCLSHSVLPQVEGSMIDSRKINKVLHISYSVSAMIKVVVGVLGALAFGLSTQSIVTLNVSSLNQVARMICAISMVGFAIFNYPLNMFIVCEGVDSLIKNTRIEKKKIFFYPWVAITRLFLVVLTVAIALVVPYFGILLAIRGSLVGTCLIFIFPCFFHLRLKWNDLSITKCIWDVLLMASGAVIGFVGLYSSIKSLVFAIEGNHI